MWTWVDGAEDVVVEPGFAVGDLVSWAVLSDDFEELLPQLPEALDVVPSSAVDDDGDAEVHGAISRIVMLTGRRRTTAHEITSTPAEHVQVLDMAGFLVELDTGTE